MSEIDPREAKLPKWAQDELRTLRMRLREAEIAAAAVRRAPAEGTDTDTYADPWAKEPILLPEGETVRFVIGPDREYHYIDVKVGGDNHYRKAGKDRATVTVASGGDRLVLLPQVTNVTLVTTESD